MSRFVTTPGEEALPESPAPLRDTTERGSNGGWSVVTLSRTVTLGRGGGGQRAHRRWPADMHAGRDM